MSKRRRVDDSRSVASAERRPVKLKLQRITGEYGRVYPPDGDGKVWWGRLQKALGTTSSAFVNASLTQLQETARMPNGPVSEIGMNAALAMIEAVAPENEVEAALAVQMTCTHMAAMNALAMVSRTSFTRNAASAASAATRLLHAYTSQMEALRRLRHGGSQFLRVEHVSVSEGGQAVIGNVKSDKR